MAPADPVRREEIRQPVGFLAQRAEADRRAGSVLGDLNERESPRLGRCTVSEAAPGAGQNRKHPAVAVGRDGRFAHAWTEGTSWDKGGVVRWQVFAKDGTPIDGQAGQVNGLPAWSVPAVVALPDGSFRVIS